MVPYLVTDVPEALNVNHLEHCWRGPDKYTVLLGLSMDEIPRFSITQSKYFLALVLGAFGGVGVVVYNLYYSPLMQNQWIYIVGSTMVCWFATSGGLFNIIRGVPFAITQRDGSIQVKPGRI